MPLDNINAETQHTSQTPNIMGWIKLEPVKDEKDKVKITGYAFSTEPTSGHFKLSVKRKAGGSSSTSNQSGAYQLENKKVKKLSQTIINVQKKDQLVISLQLYEKQTIVFSVEMIKGQGENHKIPVVYTRD